MCGFGMNYIIVIGEFRCLKPEVAAVVSLTCERVSIIGIPNTGVAVLGVFHAFVFKAYRGFVIIVVATINLRFPAVITESVTIVTIVCGELSVVRARIVRIIVIIVEEKSLDTAIIKCPRLRVPSFKVVPVDAIFALERVFFTSSLNVRASFRSIQVHNKSLVVTFNESRVHGVVSYKFYITCGNCCVALAFSGAFSIQVDVGVRIFDWLRPFADTRASKVVFFVLNVKTEGNGHLVSSPS